MRSFGAFLALCLAATLLSCEEQKEHIAPAIHDRDSVAMMTSYGVNTLISDSGVIKYRLVAEEWEVNQVRQPSRWIFEKALFMEQFDEKFQVEAYVQADTAYYYDQRRLWELRGRVSILTADGLRFTSELLFWDENRHELYSDKPSKVVTPERTLEGSYFRSDERMTRYTVSNSRGEFERNTFDSPADTLRTAPDTTKAAVRQQAAPTRRN